MAMITRKQLWPLWRAALVVLAVAAVIGAAAPSVSGQQSGETDEVVARIVARRHGDGRVEFALQQQGTGGSWGQRLLPPQRFFPTTATEGRWLVSTPLELSDAVVARIVARRHGDGRVEFALQQQGAGGSWGQRLLPPQRFFPTTATVGRWLVSTPLTLAGGAGDAALPPPIDPPPPSEDPPPPGEPPVVASLPDQLAARLLEAVNASRPASWEALTLDADLSAIVQQKAQLMADTVSWQNDFDFVTRLEPAWDVWRIGQSASADVTPDHPDIIVTELATDFAAALVADGGDAQLACPLCTHLGAGVATANGSTYATVIVAGAIPGEQLTQAAMVAAEAEMANLVNELRAFLDLDALEHHPGVAASARRWSQTMGAEGDFRHNFDLGNHYPPGYFLAGENIAAVEYSGDLSAAVRLSFGDFVNSALHYATMTEPALTHHGYGIVVKAGWVWITQNFAAYP